MKQYLQIILIVLSSSFSIYLTAQTQMVSYAYDYAGNRISRKIVDLGSSPSHVKKAEEPAPVEEQLGERKITVYPNPTKGMLGVEITGSDQSDAIRIEVFSAQGTLLQRKTAETGVNPIQMTNYPAGWYILRVQAGEKLTEFKIIKSN